MVQYPQKEVNRMVYRETVKINSSIHNVAPLAPLTERCFIHF